MNAFTIGKAVALWCVLALLAMLACGAALGLAPPTQRAEPVAQPKEEVGIEGVYWCSGEMADSSKYAGIIVFIWKHGDGYLVQWNSRGTTPSFGLGLRDGTSLRVGFQSLGKTDPGVITYRIEQDNGKPKLVGKWAQLSLGAKTNTETLTWLRAMED